MPLHKDDPGSVGGYKLLDRLGAGGMGVVYRGRARSGREVAVKVVHAQYAQDGVFRARFRQEIAAVRKVSGAFTAPVVDADPDAARPWMATQYVPGLSLATRIREQGPVGEAELRRLALGLVEALRDIHRAGVVHRDLKPANVLIAGDGPRVIDFGISRAAENSTLTETGQMIGTPPFMSPEQLTDARSVGPASDVFSLGALLVFTLTGRGPFDADSPYLTAYRVVHDAPVLDGVRQPLRDILERCLAKEAADRPRLDELAKEFAAVLPEGDDEDPATVILGAKASPDTGAAGRPGRRRRVRPLLAATGTVGALVLGLTAYLLIGPGQAESPDRALPDGWLPWQTTVFETQAGGVQMGTSGGGRTPAGEPACLTHQDAVYCAGDDIPPVRLDARTGRTLWRADAATIDPEKETYNAVLLGVRDGTLLVQQSIMTFEDDETSPSDIVGLDARTGKRLWTQHVRDENVDLALSAGLVLTSDDGGSSVTARDPRTGAVRWSVPLPKGYYCSFRPGGREAYGECTWLGDSVREQLILVLDPADGSARRLTTPADSGLAGTVDGRLVLLRSPDTDELIVEGGQYDRTELVDPDTGARTTVKLAGSLEGEPTLSGGMLWFVSDGGVVTAVSPLTGEQRWRTRTSLEQPGAATYDAAADTVYLATGSGRVAALDGRDGTVLWETLPRTGASSGMLGPGVLLYEGALVVATGDGTVFSLDPADPERRPGSG
ncbi:PQQ-binding-like beta-propeller repeat protein [Streptomyces sp. NPDC053367]|uniref:serine/threonine-protein kinase n=1 Tax=Streptomyces sp. NPDC053367 TaxID=3365700 RepID=UPI0037CFD9AD